MQRGVLEQILDGHKIGEQSETECENCEKPLHEGEDVSVGVEVSDDVARVETVHCGSCGTDGLRGIAATGRVGKLGDHAEQTHYLVVLQPRVWKTGELLRCQ
jgi:hypothetical protein